MLNSLLPKRIASNLHPSAPAPATIAQRTPGIHAGRRSGLRADIVRELLRMLAQLGARR